MSHYYIDFNLLSKQIFEQNKAAGWWDDMDRCVYQTLQLVSTEIAEATEGERKNLMDDKLPHRRMGEVELADALIRVLDFGGRYEMNFIPDLRNLALTDRMLGSIKTIGGMHFIANKALIDFGISVFSLGTELSKYEYTQLINVILQIAKSQEYDIIGAMNEKLEYNKNREDHKRENRALENGKKF